MSEAPRDAVAWLEAALEEAIRSLEQGGLPIGSVLVDGTGSIVARGHNERVQGGDPTAHAEIVCLRRAGRRDDWDTCTLVSTLSPCPMCAGAAAICRIPRIIVGEHRTYLGAEDWMRSRGLEVLVLDDPRCVELMQRFQRDQPDLWAEDIGG